MRLTARESKLACYPTSFLNDEVKIFTASVRKFKRESQVFVEFESFQKA